MLFQFKSVAVRDIDASTKRKIAGVARDQDTTTADKINSPRTLLTEYVSIQRLPTGDDPGTFDAGHDLFEETYQLASRTGVDIIVLSAIIACVGVAVPWR